MSCWGHGGLFWGRDVSNWRQVLSWSTLLAKGLLFSHLLLGSAAVVAQEVTVQTDDSGAPKILGQPTGWSIESAEPLSLATIVEGSTLYLEPFPNARVLAMLPESQLAVLESRPPWVKVRYGDQFGWVDLETPRRPLDVVITRDEAGATGEPIRLPPEKWYGYVWGPYEVLSLVGDRLVLDYLAQAAKGHLEFYTDRFGLGPKQAVSGSVVILDTQEIFRGFQRWHKVDTASNAFFSAPEYIFMFPGKKSKRELSAILIHELTHLVNWQILREFGTTHTPLPPWLDEGMADDLALSLRSHKGEFAATPLGPGNLHYGPRLGGVLNRLVSDMTPGSSGYAPSLRELMAMDPDTFLGAERERHYMLSSLWVRYLLDGAGDDVAERFRGYLATMVRGGSPHPDELASQLDRNLTQLESSFRGWLTQQRALFGL